MKSSKSSEAGRDSARNVDCEYREQRVARKDGSSCAVWTWGTAVAAAAVGVVVVVEAVEYEEQERG
jgi:hypothetical protein